jgi:3-keto-L-gulonate-6-phosphate decarboxylase
MDDQGYFAPHATLDIDLQDVAPYKARIERLQKQLRSVYRVGVWGGVTRDDVIEKVASHLQTGDMTEGTDGTTS